MAEGHAKMDTSSDDAARLELPSQSPDDINIKENMEYLQSQLIELLDSDFGLLDKLIRSRALTKVEESDVKNKDTVFKRNEKLLEYIIHKDKCNELIAALNDTNQTHLVKFVMAKGVYSEAFQLDWPLKERETNILNDNQDTLYDLLDTNELVTRLFSAKIFNARQREFIASKTTSYGRNEAFLDLLRRCSLTAFYKTIECLKLSNQAHVAKLLESGGIAVPVSVTINAVNLNSTEEQLVNRLASELLAGDRSPDEASRLLLALQLKLVAARRGNSIVLYFLCKTIDDLTYLHEMMEDGRLANILDTLFRQLMQNMEISILVIKFSGESFEKAKQSFERQLAQGAPEKADDEPMEGVQERDDDIAAAEAAAEAEAAADVEAAFEAEVDALKQQQLEEEADRLKMGTLPTREYSQEEKICAILRNNSEFLMEYIRPIGSFISQLHINECLTDDQMRLIKSLRDHSDRNDEILNSIQEEKYDTFIKCLRESHQDLVADVVEKGGVVLRVRVALKGQTIPNIEKQIVEKIKLLLDKSQVLHGEVVRMLSLLKIGNIEILDAKEEMGIIVWMWCRSGAAFTRIVKMNEDGKLNELLLWFFNKLLSNEKPQLTEIEVDIGDTEMEFASWPPSVVKRATVPSSQLGTICGVTELHGHIYVLCKKPSSIRVYDDFDFKKSSKTIPLNVVDPVDIAACNTTGSLYISDSASSSIWKVMELDNKDTKWLENVGNPFTLSVTRKGEVVMVRRDKACLEIYGPDAKKLHDIKLPAGFVPNHAVETSSGNFVLTSGEKVEISNSIFEITREGTIVKNCFLGYQDFDDLSLPAIAYLIPQEVRRLVYLRHITLDRDDHVYAADFFNGGVLLFDSRLMLCQIEKIPGVQKSLRVCMTQDETEQKLMVVHGDPTKLNVYALMGHW